jgi:hypothetical protein
VPVLASDACALVYPQDRFVKKTWSYMNSTIYYLCEELMGLRQGGGGAPLEILAGEYEHFPCFDISKIQVEDVNELLDRKVVGYLQELKRDERKKLDKKVLLEMEFGANEVEVLLSQLYSNYIDTVQDRLIKAGKNLGSKMEDKLTSEEAAQQGEKKE